MPDPAKCSRSRLPNSPHAIPPNSPNSSPAIPHHPPNTSYEISPPSLPIPTLRNSAIQTNSHIPNEIIDSPVLHSPHNIPHKHQSKKRKEKGRNVPNSKSKKVEPSKNGLKEKSKEKVYGQIGKLNSKPFPSSLPESNKLGGTSSRVGGGKASAGSQFSAVSHRKEFSRVKDVIRSDQAVGEILSHPQSLLAGNFPKPTLSRPPSLFALKFSIHHPQSILEGNLNFPNPIRPPSLLVLKFSNLHRPQSLLVGNFPNPILFNSHHCFPTEFGPSFSCLKGTIRT
jgi:hypothetical protein